jgi:hypothetical protein
MPVEDSGGHEESKFCMRGRSGLGFYALRIVAHFKIRNYMVSTARNRALPSTTR